MLELNKVRKHRTPLTSTFIKQWIQTRRPTCFVFRISPILMQNSLKTWLESRKLVKDQDIWAKVCEQFEHAVEMTAGDGHWVMAVVLNRAFSAFEKLFHFVQDCREKTLGGRPVLHLLLVRQGDHFAYSPLTIVALKYSEQQASLRFVQIALPNISELLSAPRNRKVIPLSDQ